MEMEDKKTKKMKKKVDEVEENGTERYFFL
jgi:hypothetical protein